ncbi:DNA glycosylase [Atractiella rhizophila]|nr:DNA glycosylase [Atractiella rhizophila]
MLEEDGSISVTQTPKKTSKKKKVLEESDDEGVPVIKGPFDIEEAKKHLISVDRRWKKMFERIPCKPFERTEMHHNPFRDLCSSIISQQISFLAAKSVQKKFVALFFPDAEEGTNHFPNPEQILALEGDQVAKLRAAGLSNNKARFVIDLAKHFQDGRLNMKLFKEGTDREISERLQDVAGIGPWTCDMFKIFSLKRPDVLPPGDLGVQKGMLKWFAAHPSVVNTLFLVKEADRLWQVIPALRKDKLPLSLAPGDPEEPAEEEVDGTVEPETVMSTVKSSRTMNLIDPSESAGSPNDLFPVCPTTALTKAKLESRLKSKAKPVKGAYMTPDEMRELSKSWRPYRSVGVWYMWCFVD